MTNIEKLRLVKLSKKYKAWNVIAYDNLVECFAGTAFVDQETGTVVTPDNSSAIFFGAYTEEDGTNMDPVRIRNVTTHEVIKFLKTRDIIIAVNGKYKYTEKDYD